MRRRLPGGSIYGSSLAPTETLPRSLIESDYDWIQTGS